MRWSICERLDRYEWHPWFAWYPVDTGVYRVWLEWVERRRVGDLRGKRWEMMVSTISKRQASREAMILRVEEDLRVALRPLLVSLSGIDLNAAKKIIVEVLSGYHARFPHLRFETHLDCETKSIKVEMERV